LVLKKLQPKVLIAQGSGAGGRRARKSGPIQPGMEKNGEPMVGTDILVTRARREKGEKHP